MMVETMKETQLTKRCTGPCGKRKLVPGDFYMVKRKLADGTIKQYPKAWCKECERARVRNYKNEHPEKVKRWSKNARKRADPEELRRYQREWWRMNHGKGVKVWRKYRKELEQDIRVPAGPFSEWMLQIEKKLKFVTDKEARAIQKNGPTGRWSWPAVAEAVGVDDSTLRKIKRGRNQKVSLTLVDKVGHLLGYPTLTVDLYPLEGEEAGKSRAN